MLPQAQLPLSVIFVLQPVLCPSPLTSHTFGGPGKEGRGSCLGALSLLLQGQDCFSRKQGQPWSVPLKLVSLVFQSLSDEFA